MIPQPSREAQPMAPHAAAVQAGILPVRNVRFKIGWITLLVVAALMTIGHFGLMLVETEPGLASWTAFDLYALLVISIPFRRRQKWAWYGTWILPIGLAFVAAVATELNMRVPYGAFAVLCALALLVTARGTNKNENG